MLVRNEINKKALNNVNKMELFDYVAMVTANGEVVHSCEKNEN